MCLCDRVLCCLFIIVPIISFSRVQYDIVNSACCKFHGTSVESSQHVIHIGFSGNVESVLTFRSMSLPNEIQSPEMNNETDCFDHPDLENESRVEGAKKLRKNDLCQSTTESHCLTCSIIQHAGSIANLSTLEWRQDLYNTLHTLSIAYIRVDRAKILPFNHQLIHSSGHTFLRDDIFPHKKMSEQVCVVPFSAATDYLLLQEPRLSCKHNPNHPLKKIV